MKARPLVSCILLLILVILLLSTVVKATEYNKEVKAGEIIRKIEKGEDVNLTNCRIVGELNASKMKLETVTNPNFEKLLKEGYTEEDLINKRFKEKLSVFKSNITITNSSFENGIDFSNVLFKGSADFYGATFNNSANFSEAIFNNYSYFYWATFNNSANFSEATFKNSAYFHWSTFNNSVDFSETAFNNFSYFYRVAFKNSANFSEATFKNSSYFFEVTFNNSADFWVPETSENIFTDGESCEFFMECYKAKARYTDKDNIYYNYRKNAQDNKDFLSLSELSDFLSWITCGYGVRLSHTIYCIVSILLSFSFLYWGASRFIELSNVEEKKSERKSILSRLEPILISIYGFTALGSADWYSKNNLFKILITVERLIGWIMLGIFMATLTNLMIRT